METNVTGMCGECSQCLGHTGFAPVHSMCAFPVYTAQAPDCSQGNCLWWALGCMHFPGLSRSGSGSRVLHKDTDSVRPAFCALPRSEQLRDQVLGERTLPRCGASYHLPCSSRLVSWVLSGVSGVPCLFWGADLWLRNSWRMSTIQDPRKTWVATWSLLAVW